MPNLGERIYRLRSEKNMSQGELAEKLDVSRQAVSKWENNISIPELDKIAAMSELFGVSTDVLIKGTQAPVTQEKEIQSQPIIIERTQTESGFSGRKITQMLGLIFVVLGIPLATLMLLMAADWIFIGMFILLAVDGVVLLISKKHPLLMMFIVNAALILLFLFVFEMNMAAPQQTLTEEFTEGISIEPDGYDTSIMIIE